MSSNRHAPRDAEEERRAILLGCCSRRARALLTFDNPVRTGVGRFVTLGRETLAVEMDAPLDPPPHRGSVCSVQLAVGDSSGVFLTHVVSCTDDYSGTQTLVLTEPPDLMQIECRRSFRVSGEAAEVSVRVRSTASGWVSAALVDLSRGGLRMAPTDDARPIPEGPDVVVVVAWSGREVTLPGRIVRRSGEEMAVAFVPSPQLERPDGISELVGQLERAWLRRRRDRARR